MGQITLPDNPGIEINVKRSARARRLSLRVSSLDGRVTLTMPKGVPEAEGLRFLAEKSDWIRRAVAGVPEEVDITIGASLPVMGEMRKVVPGSTRRAALDGAHLVAPSARTGAAIRAFLKTTARDRIAACIDHYAPEVARTPGRLTIRDTRSRWGSCSHKGDLMLSWRLIMAPDHVLDYVVAHEVAHLVHMDHSPRFWSVVADLRPDWRQSRDWLTANGSALHRYRFDSVD